MAYLLGIRNPSTICYAWPWFFCRVRGSTALDILTVKHFCWTNTGSWLDICEVEQQIPQDCPVQDASTRLVVRIHALRRCLTEKWFAKSGLAPPPLRNVKGQVPRRPWYAPFDNDSVTPQRDYLDVRDRYPSAWDTQVDTNPCHNRPILRSRFIHHLLSPPTPPTRVRTLLHTPPSVLPFEASTIIVKPPRCGSSL